ncbi:MAG TPA: phosphonatase-like hydrolase [Chitinophagaceae bacterium]|nr:phosphonatase-like hydrolase [Chitinophagaceae bacterium]
MIRMVVFDMAGTTVNEDNVVYKTIQKAFIEEGIDVSLEQVLQHGAGKEKLQAIKDILFEVFQISNEQLASKIHLAFKEHLVRAYEDLHVTPVEGAEDVFRFLKHSGIFCVLNTGYDSKTANGLLKKLGWDRSDLINGVVTASDVPKSRPFPDMIEAAMRKTGVNNPLEVIKIGDSTVDIKEGQNAGCGLNIGITGGAQTRKQLEEQGPDFVIDHLVELIHIIKRENTPTSFVY